MAISEDHPGYVEQGAVHKVIPKHEVEFVIAAAMLANSYASDNNYLWVEAYDLHDKSHEPDYGDNYTGLIFSGLFRNHPRVLDPYHNAHAHLVSISDEYEPEHRNDDYTPPEFTGVYDRDRLTEMDEEAEPPRHRRGD